MKRTETTCRPLLLLSVLIAATSCGGGGGGGQAQRAIQAQQVTLSFPADAVTTDAESIAIRGSIDLTPPITAVRVNGLRATSGDGFRTFSADVPLRNGANDFVIEVDRPGADTTTAEFAGRVRRVEPMLLASPDVAFDAARGRMILLDRVAGAVLAMNPRTGDRTLLSDVEHGTGPAFGAADSLAVDAEGKFAFVVDRNATSIVRVDLASGDRTTLSDFTTGTGTPLAEPFGLVFDTKNKRLLVTDTFLESVFSVDLASGDRKVISSSTVGSGPTFESIGRMTLDIARNRALALDFEARALIAVDLANGDRTIVSDATHGSGGEFSILGDVEFDADLDRALVTEVFPAAVLLVDPRNGDRSTLSDDRTGRGPELLAPGDLAVDLKSGVIDLVEVFGPAIFAVDAKSGDRRQLVGKLAVGSGAPFDSGTPITFDPASRRGFFLTSAPRGVGVVDFATGDRAPLSDPTHGSGPDFVSPTALALDADHARLLVADDFEDVLWSVSLEDGTRSVLSAETITRPLQEFHTTSAVVVDAAHGRALLVQSGDQILTVDLEDGTRSILSAFGIGSISLNNPDGATLDAGNDRLLVLQATQDLVAVSLTTGGRSVVVDSLGLNLAEIADDAGLDRILVTGGDDTEGFTAFDPASGTLTTVSSRLVLGAGRGPALPRADTIVFDEANRIALVFDDITLALYEVDVVTGDRTLVSR